LDYGEIGKEKGRAPSRRPTPTTPIKSRGSTGH